MVILGKVCGLSPINAAEDLLMIRRRQLIAGRGGVAAWPLAASAQQLAMPVIGFLNLGPPRANANYVTAFRQGLTDAGFIENRTVAIEYRWANDRWEQLQQFAAELVQ